MSVVASRRKPKGEGPDPLVNFRAPQHLIAELRSAASREQITVSEFLRRAVQELLAPVSEKKEAAPPKAASKHEPVPRLGNSSHGSIPSRRS